MLALRAALRLGRLRSQPDAADSARELIRAARQAIHTDAGVADTVEADALLVQ